MEQLDNVFITILTPEERFQMWLAENATELNNSFPTHAAAYLLNKTHAQISECLITQSENLMAAEFSRWTSNSALWPKRSDAEMLLEFFAVNGYSHVVDLSLEKLSTYAAILNPTAKFKLWLDNTLLKLGVNHSEVSLGQYREQATIYLMPEGTQTMNDIVIYFQQNYVEILSHEFKRYIIDADYWPQSLDLDTLKDKFELSAHSLFSISG